MRIAMLIVFLAAALPSLAAAQRVAAVGDRARVLTNNPTTETVGIVRAVTPNGIEIVDADRVVHFFAETGIRDVHVSEGQVVEEGRKGWALVTTIGITGAVAGIAAATWSPCDDTGEFGCFLNLGSRRNAALVGGLVALPIAIIFANGIGSDRMTDVWAEALLPSVEGPSVGLFRGATRSAIGVGISVPAGPGR